MPRPRRVHVPGALYYVTTGGADGRQLFRDDTDYITYLSLLQAYANQYAVKLFAYVLLPDQVHLVLELTGEATISDLMHALNSRYTKHVAARHGRTAHVFQNRFKSTIAEKAPSLLSITAAVHRAPQRLGVAGDFATYRWSSYPNYLAGDDGVRHPTVPDTVLELRGEAQEVLTRLAKMHPGQAYEAYVRSIPPEAVQPWKMDARQPVVGSAAFVDMVTQRSKASARRPVQPFHAEQPMPIRPESASRRPSLALAGVTLVLVVGLSALLVRQVARPGQTVVLVAPGNHTTLPARVAMAVYGDLAEELATLQGSGWDIQLIPMHAQSPSAPRQDQLIFTQTKIVSRLLTAEGYLSSKYLVARTPEGQLVWETIQTNRTGEIVSWRGEWQGTIMRGTMARQATSRIPEQFTFVGVSKPAETIRSET